MSFLAAFKSGFDDETARREAIALEEVTPRSMCYRCKRRPKFSDDMDVCERCWDKSKEKSLEEGPHAITSLCTTLHKHLQQEFSQGKHRKAWNSVTQAIAASISHIVCEELSIKASKLGGPEKINPALYDLCKNNEIIGEQMVYEALKPLWLGGGYFPAKSIL